MVEEKKRIRYSLGQLETDPELRPQLEKLLIAFKGIQELPPHDLNSFYQIGGFHGEPFRGPNKAPGPKAGTSKENTSQRLWWGGYCNHGNVLFPTWHRAYMLRMENALRSIPGCEEVTLPFWDETFYMPEWEKDPDRKNPRPAVVPYLVPKILTDKEVFFDGKMQRNPLFSYKLQRHTTFFLNDKGKPDDKRNSRHSKPEGYETCRFPMRGIVFNETEQGKSNKWNAQFNLESESESILNINVLQWLEETIGSQINRRPKGSPQNKDIRIPDTISVYSRFRDCLDAPNYTVFSCNPAQNQYREDAKDKKARERARIVSLESPHNAMHLAVGGFYQEGVYNANPKQYQDANGDMGDNETASFDPMFYFHHAFIDYVFWVYQQKNNLTKRGSLDVICDYPGTVTDEASPIGLAPGATLDMDTPLYPFRNPKGGWMTSHDVTDIAELNYEYKNGSLDRFLEDQPFQVADALDQHTNREAVAFKRVAGINRANIEGSFVIRTFATYDGDKIEVDRAAILSRYNVNDCQNCQSHLEAESLFPVYQDVFTALGATDNEKAKQVTYKIEIESRSGPDAIKSLVKANGYVEDVDN